MGLRRARSQFLDRLLEASQQPAMYEITDYHWLVVHECLEMSAASTTTTPSVMTVTQGDSRRSGRSQT